MTTPITIQPENEAIAKPLLPAPILDHFKAHRFAASPSGVDSNLLILLHGLGDSSEPFFQLAQNLQKTLPQTAVLSLQAPYMLPFLEGNHWMWWPTFDQFAEILTAPNPTKTVSEMMELLRHLTAPVKTKESKDDSRSGCGWNPRNIHFFGFGQGATCALETMVQWSKSAAESPLGSILSVAGDFISHPTLASDGKTPVYHLYRSKKDEGAKLGSFRKATKNFTSHRLELAPGDVEEAMPRNKDEWDLIMKFWAKLFRYRNTWDLKGEIIPLS